MHEPEKATERFRREAHVYAHFEEKLTRVLEPLVHVSIVARFQHFDDSIIATCFSEATLTWQPMRPPVRCACASRARRAPSPCVCTCSHHARGRGRRRRSSRLCRR